MISRAVSDWSLRLYVGLCLAFLLLPIALVILFSLSSRSLAAFPFEGPSLRWYRDAFADDVMTSALVASVKLALLSSTIGVAIGGAAAYGLARANRRAAALFTSLVSLPLVLPLLIIAIALVTAFNEIGVKLSMWTALVGHTILVLPLSFVIIAARLGRFDWSVEEASRDLGAGPVGTFLRVVLPSIGPSIVGAFAISMAFSLDEFVVTFFTIGIDNTLPTVLWSRMRTFLDPSVNAIGTVIVLGTAILTAIAAWIGRVRI